MSQVVNDDGNASSKSSPQYSFGDPPPMGNATMGPMFGTVEPAQQALPIRAFRGDSLLQPYKMRERFRRKEVMVGYALGLPSADVAR